MSLKSFVIKQYAKRIAKNVTKTSKQAVEDQNRILKQLLKTASHTQFGKDHRFSDINTYEDYKQQVPIRDYEGLREYVEKIKAGQSDVLWKGQPKYFAKTSGTTSGVKYIPVSKESIADQISSARSALLNYVSQSNKNVFDGSVIFLSGSPELTTVGGVKTGRLSGIVNHEIPTWVKNSQLPSYKTNCIEDWESKLDKIIEETIDKDMTLISGIPPWVQMYFDNLERKI